jgi:hypothetical protein
VERGAIASDLSIPDIEKAVFRLVAVKMTGSLAEAADLLGMASVSLTRWLARRDGDPHNGSIIDPGRGASRDRRRS